MKWDVSLLLFMVALGLWGCASSPPVAEYAIARTALESAREKEAARYASGYWHRAEEYYRKGEKAFQDSDFNGARGYFERARIFAEKAENSTRLKLFQTGEGIP